MSADRKLRRRLDELVAGLAVAAEGTGPLLQRDYWAVIEDCRHSPQEMASILVQDFPEYAPEELVCFERLGDGTEPLEEGDELEVTIRMAGKCGVRVVHRNANSVTLGTLEGHPEAGRITFGAYRSDDGGVVFHIRSRARASTGIKYMGFLTAGEPMQTNTWTDFVDRVAHTFGSGVVGAIRAETQEIDDEDAEPETICSPTFHAVGD